VDMFWQIKPAFQDVRATGLNIHWLDFAAFIGIGGLWLYFFLTSLAKMNVPLLPAHDPRMRGNKPVIEESSTAAAQA